MQKRNGFNDILIGFEDTGAVNPSTAKKIWKLVDPQTRREHQHKSKQDWTYEDLEELEEEVTRIDKRRIKEVEELFKPSEEYVILAEKERKEFEARQEEFNAQRRAENQRIKQRQQQMQKQESQLNLYAEEVLA